MIEEWRDVKDYQGKYQVSNLGRIKSLNYNKTKKEKILIEVENGKGYKTVLLSKNGKKIRFYVHRLVYTAFVGVITDGYQIDHINNNKTDNRLQNLQLLTSSENNKKRYIDNPNYKNNGGRAKIKIKCLNNNVIYNSINDASRRLNLNSGSIYSVLKGRCKQIKGYSFEYIDEQTEDKQIGM